jgi:hypothetical protein
MKIQMPITLKKVNAVMVLLSLASLRISKKGGRLLLDVAV